MGIQLCVEGKATYVWCGNSAQNKSHSIQLSSIRDRNYSNGDLEQQNAKNFNEHTMRFPGTTHLEVLLGFLSPQPWFYWDSDLQTISDIDEKSSLEVYGIISWLLSRYDTQIWKLLLCDLEMSARKIPVRECAGE